ncbi:YceD family protein [Sphingomonas prati]|uniref:Uncharacterized metal-binding protein YceD (DUF177 family) n=1 Tax=Sphingomonas prati TaxID=1843237 RepID=A0A7W9BTS3_9SPHN|nr:DUF177 domain-containing protein [Sphingomonas prati]MBB5729973.1 uncharacterized metal-binding protein YceD (DUF177 family) [Sphingomonas prati]GGE88073.1 hypothetical protein GCM10011404_21120 [Sphingomonas prati]
MSAPEFSRPVRIDSIGETGKIVTVTATEAECAALAGRFDLIGIERLAATVDCRRKGTDVTVTGRLTGVAVQACVATAVPIPATIDQAFALTFVPALSVEGDEMELDAGDLDVVAYDGAAVDLGEAVAETFALALDPFPRSVDAEAVLRAAGVQAEDEVEAEPGAFAGLAALRGKLGG